MKIYAPDGEVGRATTPLTPLPANLAGQRLVCLDNGKPGASVLLERLASEIAARTGVVDGGQLLKGSAATPCEEDRLQELRTQADWVLTGTAD